MRHLFFDYKVLFIFQFTNKLLSITPTPRNSNSCLPFHRPPLPLFSLSLYYRCTSIRLPQPKLSPSTLFSRPSFSLCLFLSIRRKLRAGALFHPRSLIRPRACTSETRARVCLSLSHCVTRKESAGARLWLSTAYIRAPVSPIHACARAREIFAPSRAFPVLFLNPRFPVRGIYAAVREMIRRRDHR